MDYLNINVKIKFITEILGSQPMDSDIFSRFIASQAPTPEAQAEEIEVALSQEEKEIIQGKTQFPRDREGYCCFLDYQIRGFLKEAGNNLKEQMSLKAVKSKIDNFVFIDPRYIRISPEIKDVPDTLQRPLRAQTPQGPRVCLASSEMIPEGAELSFKIKIIKNKDIDSKVIREILSYGELQGLGQWRNGSYGRLEVKEFTVMS